MLMMSMSKAGNLVTIETTIDEEGILLEFTSKNTVVYDSVERNTSFVDAINKMKSVLADEETNL